VRAAGIPFRCQEPAPGAMPDRWQGAKLRR
jgi:hypothetical protein